MTITELKKMQNKALAIKIPTWVRKRSRGYYMTEYTGTRVVIGICKLEYLGKHKYLLKLGNELFSQSQIERIKEWKELP